MTVRNEKHNIVAVVEMARVANLMQKRGGVRVIDDLSRGYDVGVKQSLLNVWALVKIGMSYPMTPVQAYDAAGELLEARASLIKDPHIGYYKKVGAVLAPPMMLS